jgi:hypothetical protein
VRLSINHPRAKRLPSRRRFALARLIALATFRSGTEGAPADRVVYAVDTDHDAVESYFMSAWFSVMAFAYAAALVPQRGFVAVALAIVLTPVVMHVSLFTAALFTGYTDRDWRRYQSIFHMTLFITLSIHVAQLSSPARYVAWASLALCAANAVAAVIMFFARDAVRRMEAECGI